MNSLPNNIIGNNVRRCIRNRFIYALLILAFSGYLGALSLNYFYNLIYGPFQVTAQDILAIDNVSNYRNSFVSFKGFEGADTGFTDVVKKQDKYSKEITSEETTGKFMAYMVEDKILLVKSELNHVGNDYIGTFVVIPDYVQSDVLTQLQIDVPESKGRFLPFMLDESNRPSVIWLLVLLAALMYGGNELYKAISYIQNFEKHPIVKSLRIFGDPELIALRIDEESRSDQNINFGNLLITKSWLLQKLRYTMQIISLKDIVWIYKKVTKKSVNFIPTGKTYAVVIKTSKGQVLEQSLGETQVENLMIMIHKMVPGVLLGFTQEIENLWNRNRADLIAAVEEAKMKAKDSVLDDKKTKDEFVENNISGKAKEFKCPACQKINSELDYSCSACGEKFWKDEQAYQQAMTEMKKN